MSSETPRPRSVTDADAAAATETVAEVTSTTDRFDLWLGVATFALGCAYIYSGIRDLKVKKAPEVKPA